MSWMEAVVWSGAYGGWQQPCYCFAQGRSWPLLHSKRNPYQAALWWSLHNWFLFRFILITLQKYIFHQIEGLSSLKPWKGLDSITSDISNSKLWTWKKHFKAWLCEASSAQAEQQRWNNCNLCSRKQWLSECKPQIPLIYSKICIIVRFEIHVWYAVLVAVRMYNTGPRLQDKI